LSFSSDHPAPLPDIVSKEMTLVPVTTLDPEAALMVVDLQKGLLSSPFIHPLAGVTERTETLLEVFRRLELPVVRVNVAGAAAGRIEQPSNRIYPKGWTGLLPELGRQPGDIALTKRRWDAFASTGLEDQLRVQGATQLILAGAAAGTGVEAKARRRMRRDSTLLRPRTP
jgi:nicotinamidase-related amidase